jgi:hypothetical protein
LYDTPDSATEVLGSEISLSHEIDRADYTKIAHTPADQTLLKAWFIQRPSERRPRLGESDYGDWRGLTSCK